MPRTTSNLQRQRSSDALRGDDVHFHQSERYAAVVNPTDEAIQAWGYGRRAVLVPGELNDPTRACVQFIDKRIAQKMVYNQRRVLEILSFDQGRRLLKRAKELGDFYQAYSELTGRTLSKAAQEIRRRQTMQLLRRQLDELGIQVRREWDIDTLRAILRDPMKAFDTDAGPAPREADDEFDPYIQKQPGKQRLKDTGTVGDMGLPGDRIDPTTLEDADAPPEVVMSEALLREEKGLDPYPTTQGEVQPISEVKERASRVQADTEEAAELRKEIRMLGGKVHPRTRNIEKLRDMVAELKEAPAAG